MESLSCLLKEKQSSLYNSTDRKPCMSLGMFNMKKNPIEQRTLFNLE